MTDTVQIALIVSIAPTIGAFSALYVSWLNRTANRSIEQKIDVQTDVVAELRTNTDGKLTKVMELAEAQALAAGIDKGRQIEVAERAARVVEAERVEDRAAAIENKK